FGQGDGLNVSFGVGVAINELLDSVEAIVDNTPVTGDSITVRAGTTDQSSIDALAIGGALGIHIGTGDASGVDLSAGVAVAVNTIARTVQALVRNGAHLDGRTGAVAVEALDKSKIHSDAGGFAITIGVGLGDGTGVAISAGVSVTINDIGNTVKAQVT